MSTLDLPSEGLNNIPAGEVKAPRRPARTRSGRFVRMVGLLGGITLLANGGVWATWNDFSAASVPFGWAVVSAGLSLSFIAASLLGFRYAHPALRTVYTLSATWLGALNYAIFAAVACWLVGGVAQLMGAVALRSAVAPLFFGAALAAVVFGLVNAARIRVTRITVSLPDLPEAWAGRTAALVTDIHLGHVAGPGFLRRVLARLRALRPDMVLISGDLFDGTPIGLDRLVADLKGFSVERGVYYVTGNHDEFADRALYLEAVRRTGVRVLDVIPPIRAT